MEKQINQVCGVNLSIFLCFLQCADGDKTCHLWTAVDLAFFVLMGVAGGLLGALFNCINKRLAKYRMRNVHPKARFIRFHLNYGFVLIKTGELSCSDNMSSCLTLYWFDWQGAGESAGVYGDHTSDLRGVSGSGGVSRFSFHQ